MLLGPHHRHHLKNRIASTACGRPFAGASHAATIPSLLLAAPEIEEGQSYPRSQLPKPLALKDLPLQLQLLTLQEPLTAPILSRVDLLFLER